MDAPFEYVFPAIRGLQAGREYYVSMCPLRLLPKITVFDNEELVPELRAQRRLNRARLPEMARYVNENPSSYIFSAITVSIDAEVRFIPMKSEGSSQRIGLLHVPMEARFVINDGQHRRAAIQLALEENPALGDESIAVVFFMDVGLERSQQMFADLNRYAIRPTTSLGVLYDHRDEQAQLIKLVILDSPLFKDLVEMERSSLSARSRRLFTLSAMYRATKALLAHEHDAPVEEQAARALEFWHEVAKHMPEWEHVRQGKITAGEIRRDRIHSHGIVLQALGHLGSTLLQSGEPWKRRLAGLKTIDWSRSNASLWEGRALSGGRVSKAGNHVTLTTNAIKSHLGLPLSPEESQTERNFMRGRNVQA